MNVPIVSIPEAAYELSSGTPLQRASRTLKYINVLYRCGAIGVSAAYIISLVLRPMLDTLANRRKEYIEHVRKGLCAAYIRLSHHVKEVPQIHHRGDKICVDMGTSPEFTISTCDFDALAEKLEELAKALESGCRKRVECTPTTAAAQKLFKKCELDYFEVEPSFSLDGRNLARDIVTEARLVKGCLITGKTID